MALRVSAEPPRPCLQRVHIGSAPLSSGLWQDVARWAGTDCVVNMYGITETANWIAGASLADAPAEDGLIGTMWGGSAAVLAEDGQPGSRGEGELLVQTPSLMLGYHARPDLTEPVLRHGWYHTGDTGHIDKDGKIRLVGRRKSEINKAGMKVHPEEVDLLLERHPGVAEACCFGLPDPVSGEVVGVAVTLAAGASGDRPGPAIADLRDWCRARIKAECVPDRWFVIAEIPKTDRGKVNRESVRDHCLQQEPG
jgi:acyl-coenzyme A synthetase/AMP-(fatty) acid ligase